MSTFQVVLITLGAVALGAFLIMLVVAWFAMTMDTSSNPFVLIREARQERRKQRVRATNEGYRTAPEDEETDLEVVGSSKAIPVDPENMPRMLTYNPRPGAQGRSCDCHARALTPGQKILWWPRVDVPHAVYVFCEEVGSE